MGDEEQTETNNEAIERLRKQVEKKYKFTDFYYTSSSTLSVSNTSSTWSYNYYAPTYQGNVDPFVVTETDVELEPLIEPLEEDVAWEDMDH